MQTISVSQGIDADFTITLLDDQGNLVTAYDGSEVLSADCWAGEDQTTAFAPAAVWLVPVEGTIKLTFAGSDTAGLTEGKYLVRLTILSSGRVLEAWRGWLRVTASPGLAAALSVYCSLSDMLLYAPAIQDLQEETDEAGFLRQRHQARRYIDRYIQGRWKGYRLLSPKYTGGNVAGYAPTDPWLQLQLDTDKLMLDARLVEVACKLSISYVYDSALGGDDTRRSEYRVVATRFRREVASLLKCTIFGIDFNGDGYADLGIGSFLTDTRY